MKYLPIALVMLALIIVVVGCGSVTQEQQKVFTNSIGMKLVYIHPGEFLIGSPSEQIDQDSDEGSQHRVRISEGFYMGIHEVTRGQFSAFVQDSGHKTDVEKEGWAYAWKGSSWDKVKGASWRNPGFSQQDNHPVVCVSWNDAKVFCEWLSRKENTTYRLPSEAQWEYTCRAGTQTQYSFGDADEDLYKYGNYADSSTSFPWRDKGHNDGSKFTGPVGSMKPNPFCLYDMHGNVWEWCADWHDKDYYSKSPGVDPTGPTSGEAHVLRGGSWYDDPWICRSAIRGRITPLSLRKSHGFRVVSLDLE